MCSFRGRSELAAATLGDPHAAPLGLETSFEAGCATKMPPLRGWGCPTLSTARIFIGLPNIQGERREAAADGVRFASERIGWLPFAPPCELVIPLVSCRRLHRAARRCHRVFAHNRSNLPG